MAARVVDTRVLEILFGVEKGAEPTVAEFFGMLAAARKAKEHNLVLVLELLARQRFEGDPPSAFPDHEVTYEVGEIDWEALADKVDVQADDPDFEPTPDWKALRDLLVLIDDPAERANQNALTLGRIVGEGLAECYEIEIESGKNKEGRAVFERVLTEKNLGGDLAQITEDWKKETATTINVRLSTTEAWLNSRDAQRASKLLDLLVPGDEDDLFNDDNTDLIPVDWEVLSRLFLAGSKRKAEDKALGHKAKKTCTEQLVPASAE